MKEVRGNITDRPWGITLGAIAARRHTGQLTVESDGKRYATAFTDGAIVAATSPLAADAIARVALTNHFITSTQVGDITRRLALSPDRDEVDVLVDTIRCSPDQAGKLRRRLVAQRAARTFSLEQGDFVLEDRITIPVYAGVTIDHRYAIYLGVRTNLSEQRLIDDLRQLGPHFVLRPDAIQALPFFGFEPSAHPVLEALKAGTSLPELEAANRDLDPRLAQAVIYALASCGACVLSPRTATSQPGAPRAAPPPPPRDPGPPRPRTASSSPAVPASARARTPTSPAAPRTVVPSPTTYSSTTAQDSGTNTPAATRPRAQTDHGASRAQPAPPPSTARAPTPALPMPARTPTPAVSTAARSRTPTGTTTSPPRPAVTRVPTSDADVVRSFAEQHTPGGFLDQRTPGFGVQYTPADQRTSSHQAVPRAYGSGPTPSRVSTDTAIAAEEAFKRGELAMKRDQPGEAILEYKAACDLNPNEVDYAAMFAWAMFCAAGDKAAVGGETRKALERAVFKSYRPERARFYLGRVERMLGRDKEALQHFQEVLALKPNHGDAASEVRAIEARLQAASKTGTGLFGRKR